MRGNSGANLSFAGDYVLKECSNAKDQCEWFCHAEKAGLVDGVVLPYVELINEHSYKIEYVSGCSGTMITATQDLQRLINLVECWGKQPAASSADWDSYLVRLESHVRVSNSEAMKEALALVSRYILPGSFGHGDLTLENVLVRPDGGMVLIDPNYSDSLFQSHVLDFGKILQSVHSDYHRRFNSSPGEDPKPLFQCLKRYLKNASVWDLALVSEISHIIRLRSYRPEAERTIVDSLLEKLIREI